MCRLTNTFTAQSKPPTTQVVGAVGVSAALAPWDVELRSVFNDSPVPLPKRYRRQKLQ
jgi:hypothetical protein